jgi:hypothetical protein
MIGCLLNNNDLQGLIYRRKRSRPNLSFYPSICLQGPTKTAKNFRRDSKCLDRDLIPGSPGVLTTVPQFCGCPNFLQFKSQLAPSMEFLTSRLITFKLNILTQLP